MEFDGSVTSDSKTSGGLIFAELYFFEIVSDAQAWRRHELLSVPAEFLKIAEQAMQIDRNVYIVWGSGAQEPTSRANSILHGCLRGVFSEPAPPTATLSATVRPDLPSSSRLTERKMRRAEAIIAARLRDRGARVTVGHKRGSQVLRIKARGPEMTSADLSQTGNADQALQHFAIVIDRQLKSFPSIDFRNYPNGVDPVNGAQITGLDSINEAKGIALALRSGLLPAGFVIVGSPRIVR